MGGFYRLNDFGFRLSAGAHVIPRAQFAAVDEATQLVAGAERRAAEIVQDAEREFERQKERGYQDGLAQARLEAVERLIAEQQVLERGLAGIEQGLAQVVSDCVRRIIEGFDDQTRAESVVRQALKKMRREKRVEVRAAPAACAVLRDRVRGIMQEFPEVELIDVVEDSSLEPQRIIVETSIGRVDGNLAQRLDDLDAAIRGALAKPAAESAASAGEAGSDVA